VQLVGDFETFVGERLVAREADLPVDIPGFTLQASGGGPTEREQQ
jgi:hypothetical protein